jgi:hypothetical protein
MVKYNQHIDITHATNTMTRFEYAILQRIMMRLPMQQADQEELYLTATEIYQTASVDNITDKEQALRLFELFMARRYFIIIIRVVRDKLGKIIDGRYESVISYHGERLFNARVTINPLSNEVMGYEIQPSLSWYNKDTRRLKIVPWKWILKIPKDLQFRNYALSTLAVMVYIYHQYSSTKQYLQSNDIPEQEHDFTFFVKSNFIRRHLLSCQQRWEEQHKKAVFTALQEIGWVDSWRTVGDYDIYTLNPDHLEEEISSAKA